MDRIYRVRQGMGGRYVVERDNALYWLEGDLFGDYRAGAGISEPLRDFLAPVMPSKIMAIGLNYKDHAAEMKKPLPAEPLLFIKPPTSVIGPEAAIGIPSWPGRIEHEAEMAVVIGRRASHVKARDAMDYILGCRPRMSSTPGPRASTRSRRSARASPSAWIRRNSRSRVG
jgi:2-keto-4-pentenoate hydratase/2-oxohepta-3-ene-1,7-dioic acid hydratase in catechol pathway